MAKEKFKAIEIKNRKATHEYTFINTFEAGIVLTGTEVKSIRAGYANLNDAFCHFIEGELFIRNLHISEYALGTYYNHEAKRVRKLLLKKEELNKLIRKTAEKGFTIVPYRIYTTERGFIKIEIALAQGKKSFDKRETLKERDSKRDLDRIKKAYK